MPTTVDAPARPTRAPHAKLAAVPFDRVTWAGGFWAGRYAMTRDAMVPAMGRLMQAQQRFKYLGNFEVAAGLAEGRHRGPKWNDGDFYKWLESAAAVYRATRDPALEAEMDAIIALIARAQEPDGYVHTDVTIRRRNGEDVPRFGNPMDFEMYNMGHLMTAACVHHYATGKTNLLDLAIKAADFLVKQFAQPTPDVARHGICPAHLMGLTDLYRTTGNRAYIDLAVKLLDMRDLVAKGDDDNQDRIPFRQQRTAHGHAVRATYLYAGAADVYSETGDATLLAPLDPIWHDLVSRKLYVTGGCGALYDGASPDGAIDQLGITRVHQAFGRDYQLPHSTAHNETCAAIGNLLWNWRMLQLTGEARFGEVVEQTLLNSVLAGVSLDGEKFFYTNTLRQLDPMPVELRWNRHRESSLGCFCCPPNVARTMAESGTYAYLLGDAEVRVVLYGGNTLNATLPSGEPVRLRQETDYPWDGRVKITVDAAPAGNFALHLRLSEWMRGATVRVNGRAAPGEPRPGTFFAVERTWAAGDVVELEFPMPARLLEANPLVEENRNQVAIARGPVVYCLESIDLPAGAKLLDVSLPADARLTPSADERLPGVTTLRGKVLVDAGGDWSGRLYRERPTTPGREVDAQFVPYFAWDNRGEGEMSVWLPLATG